MEHTPDPWTTQQLAKLDAEYPDPPWNDAKPSNEEENMNGDSKECRIGHGVPEGFRQVGTAEETSYRIEDDVELLADQYVRRTAPGGVAYSPESSEPALLTKKQVAALIRDAFVAGYIRHLTRP